MKALVVGGAGYIGSHFVHYLCEKTDWCVGVMDNLSTGRSDNVDERSLFYHGDIRRCQDIALAFKRFKPDIVFCFAGLKAAGESMIDPVSYTETNIRGTMNLINLMVEFKIRYFVFSSSAAVYGMPHFLPITETHLTDPASYYGYTKLEIERTLEWYSKLGKIRYSALRYFNAAGYCISPTDMYTPHRENSPTNLLPIVMETALAERKCVDVFGNDYPTHDGTGVRDYIHIDDLASAHFRAADHIMFHNKDLVVNLGTERGYSVLEVIDAAEEITGRTIPRRIVERRPGDCAEVIASNKEAREVLDWAPRYSTLNILLTTMWNVYKKDLR